MCLETAFYIATGHTLLRCLIAFAISVILGVGLGILAGLKPSFAELLRPFVHLVKAAPTMALTLLILVWFRQKATPVVIATMLVFPILYSTVSSAVQATDKGLLEMASVYQLRTKDKLKCIYVPHILPLLVDNAATAFSMCIKATISAEILALVPQSMGSSMKFAKDGIIEGAGLLFAWLLMAILLSVLVEVLLRLLAKRIKRSYHISEV